MTYLWQKPLGAGEFITPQTSRPKPTPLHTPARKASFFISLQLDDEQVAVRWRDGRVQNRVYSRRPKNTVRQSRLNACSGAVQDGKIPPHTIHHNCTKPTNRTLRKRASGPVRGRRAQARIRAVRPGLRRWSRMSGKTSITLMQFSSRAFSSDHITALRQRLEGCIGWGHFVTARLKLITPSGRGRPAPRERVDSACLKVRKGARADTSNNDSRYIIHA